MKKKKIIFFSRNMNIGGMEKALVNLLNELINDYDITLVLEEKKGVLLNCLNKNIKITEYNLANCQNKILRKIKNFTKRITWSVKNYHKYNFSCNYATYSLLGTKLSQIASKNSMLYVHSNYSEMLKEEENVKIFFKPYQLKKFNNIVFVSNESKNGMSKIYPDLSEKFSVINNLIDYENILDLATEKNNFNVNPKDTNFIFIGRLENESKNIDLLLKSFKESVQENNKIKLLILGSGPYKTETLTYIKKNNLDSNITLIDEVTNPYSYLNKSDCLILTSNYEGFPVVYLEALVLNKRIMSTITCSDETLNMADYIIKINHNINDISSKILNYKKEKISYNIDFEKLNAKKITQIKKLIER